MEKLLPTWPKAWPKGLQGLQAFDTKEAHAKLCRLRSSPLTGGTNHWADRGDLCENVDGVFELRGMVTHAG